MDFIGDFISATTHLPCPERFRRWAAIACVAGAVERRVWTQLVAGKMYPNAYMLLVGSPASGKTIPIAHARSLLVQTRVFLSPDSATKAALIDKIANSHTARTIEGVMYEYSAITALLAELSHMIRSYDHEFLGVLNNIYDTPERHQDFVRHGNHSKDIVNPSVTFCAATQPDYLGDIFPESAWNTGFMTRVVLVYSAVSIKDNDVFAEAPADTPQWRALAAQLRDMTNIAGVIQWSENAKRDFRKWRSAGCPPAPSHPRLRFYNNRREFFVAKTAMADAISRGLMSVSVETFERARSWLEEAEDGVEGVFETMHGRSDIAVIDDMMSKLRREHAEGAIIKQDELMRILSTRVVVERMEKIINAAQKMNLLTCSNGITMEYYWGRAKS